MRRNHEDQRVTELRLRPTFELPVALPPDEIIGRLRARLRDGDVRNCSATAARCVDLRVDAAARRIWSPHLSVQLREAPGGSVLYGRYGPHPEVWTFFMFLYFGAWFALVLGGIWAYVQWASGEPVGAVWVPLVALVVVLGVHVAGTLGRRLGRAQMRELRARLDLLLSDL